MLRKSADENKTLSFSIDDGIRIDLDIPPVEYSYKIIE